MKLLITGFDPFGGATINPAYEAVKLLPDKIEDCDIPESFRGTASVLIAAGILSLSFMGFYGMAENMLGL